MPVFLDGGIGAAVLFWVGNTMQWIKRNLVKMNSRPRLWQQAFVLALLSLCIEACTKPEAYTIGFVGVLSGPGADLGVSGRNGVMLAIEEHNNAIGHTGSKIELLVRDTKRELETARQVTQELIVKKVELIIGPMTSGTAMQLVPMVNGSSSILLSPTVTTTDLTGIDDNFVRVIDDTRTYARKSARYQYAQLGHHTFSVIYDISNKSYSERWLRDFRKEFENQGGKLLDIRPFTPSTEATFLDASVALLKHQPDTVLVIGTSVDAALICQQLRKLNPAQNIVLSEWPTTERFIELAGEAAEGVVAAQFINRADSNPRFQAFRKAFLARFGAEPGFAGLAGYDAGKIAIKAVETRKTGDTLKETILDAGTFDGAQSPVHIDKFGDAKRETYITRIHNGRFETVEYRP